MTDLVAIVHVNWGTWLARCPRDGCTNAEHYGPAPVTRHVGGLTGDRFHCRICNLRCGADWPPDVDEIAYLLSLRPAPATRNWRPGETTHDLLVENLVHGIVPASIEADARRIGGDRIAGLPALPANERLSIGAA